MKHLGKDKVITFRTLWDNRQGFEVVERKIKLALKKHLYAPLLKALALPQNKMFNDSNALLEQIRSGQIKFHRGRFSGQFNAASSKELKRIGAKWDRSTGTF